MIEHKQLHDWASWKDEWTYAEAEKALEEVGLKDWKIDHWSDGDMQFMHKNPVMLDDLVKLKAAFAPVHMAIEAVTDFEESDRLHVEWEAKGSHPLDREPVPLMILVSMSWNNAKDLP